jgi:hypothetical protein
MYTIKTIKFPGYEELKNNFNKYKKIFLDEQIIAFRDANIDFNMQTKIIHLFGDNLGWYPNSLNTNPSHYIETHHNHMNEKNVSDKKSIMLQWHQEHVAQEHNPYVSGFWNMVLFKCDENAGKTYFVDMSKLFNMFNHEDQDFLSKCQVLIKNYRWHGKKDYYYYVDEKDAKNNNNNLVTYNLVSEHWITKEKTIRTYLSKDEDTKLYKFNNQNPTIEEINKYKEISKKINNEVNNNESIRMQHIWKQGDLLVPDLFKLSHAVSGGFNKDQRQLNGMFGTLKPWPKQD